jgi:hypothetical protein
MIQKKFTKTFCPRTKISKYEAQLLQSNVMDDIHSNTRLPGKPYEAVGQQTLTRPLYDADNVTGPLQEACLECLQSNPLSFVPLPHNLQHPIVALETPLLIAE